jgi:hypothetical protein
MAFLFYNQEDEFKKLISWSGWKGDQTPSDLLPNCEKCIPCKSTVHNALRIIDNIKLMKKRKASLKK